MAEMAERNWRERTGSSVATSRWPALQRNAPLASSFDMWCQPAWELFQSTAPLARQSNVTWDTFRTALQEALDPDDLGPLPYPVPMVVLAFALWDGSTATSPQDTDAKLETLLDRNAMNRILSLWARHGGQHLLPTTAHLSVVAFLRRFLHTKTR